MNTKQSTSKNMQWVYQLWVRKETEDRSFIYDTYLHQSSAIRARNRLDGLYDCTCWVDRISVEEYNAKLVRDVIKELRQKEIEDECNRFIDKNIEDICASIHSGIKDRNVENEIKRKLLEGEAVAYVEAMKVNGNPLIESVILGAQIAFKRDHYDITIGIKTKDCPFAAKGEGIMMPIACCETFQMLSEHMSEAVNPCVVKAVLKQTVRSKLYE